MLQEWAAKSKTKLGAQNRQNNAPGTFSTHWHTPAYLLTGIPPASRLE